MSRAPAPVWLWCAVIAVLLTVLSAAGQTIGANGLDHPTTADPMAQVEP